MIRVATDAGGTFTDLVAFDDETGRIHLGKALTTPRDPSEGVVAAIRQAGADGMRASAAGLFVHGGTTVINAITERKGVRTALITNRGFRDVLAIGRGNRPDMYNLQASPPEPFVPRHLRFEATGRIDARGRERVPLDLDDIDRAAAAMQAQGVAAAAIVFLHSYLNPAHEAAAAARLRALLPSVSVTASHEISRQWREYERSNTAVLSAYVQPLMARYLSGLDGALRREGLACPGYCMLSSGGLADFAASAAAPLAMVESGPAGGVAGTVRIGEALGEADILYFDVGGTTAKCSLVQAGRPVLRPDYRLEWSRRNPGYPVQVPVVDIVEIGAGGGSIARADAQGLLRVGPDSAGSDPGPACYGRGGTLPTVTDAKLLTGAIDAARFAGGRITLDPARAEAAFAPLAACLGTSVTTAAEAVIRVAESNMINALRLVTIQRGHDPRDLAMVACGGGGPMHAAALARELGLKRVVVPPFAGLFSAWGMLAARPRIDLHRTRLLPATADSLSIARAVFAELAEMARARFGGAGELLLSCGVEARYAGQEHTVATPFDPAADLGGFLAEFHAAHERAYTFRLADTPAELVTFHLAAELAGPRIALPPVEAGRRLADAITGRRQMRPGDGSAVEATIYARDRLPPGAAFDGPALIEEPATTTLVLPGQRAVRDRHGLLLIEDAGAAS